MTIDTRFAEFNAGSVRRLAEDALRQLNVTETVRVLDVAEMPLGLWRVRFADSDRHRRWPEFEIAVPPTLASTAAARELRLELRKKLSTCPLCQHRAEIERVEDRDAVRVECDTCTTFEITGSLIGLLRRAHDAGYEPVISRLPRLSAGVSRSGAVPVLTTENWIAFAE